MPDPNTPPPPPPPDSPGRPIDAWFDGDQPPWDDAAGPKPPTVAAKPVGPGPVAPTGPVTTGDFNAPTVVPVAARAKAVPLVPDDLPEARPVGPRANPRPPSPPSNRPLGAPDRDVEPDRPRAQVLLACSVLMAIIVAMMIAVAVLCVALYSGFRKVQKSKPTTNAPGVVQPQNPPVVPKGNNPRPGKMGIPKNGGGDDQP